MPGKVALVVTSHNQLGDTGKQTGWYLPEVAHPFYVFEKAGFEIVVASPKGGEAECDNGSIDATKEDAECVKFLAEKCPGNKLASVASETLKAADFDAIFFAGGHGTVYDFPNCTAQIKLTEEIWAKGGVVAAVCHGPAALANVKVNGEPLVKGKKVCAFTTEEETMVQLTELIEKTWLPEKELTALGGVWAGGAAWADNVVADGMLVTGQNPTSGGSTAKKVVELVGAK